MSTTQILDHPKLQGIRGLPSAFGPRGSRALRKSDTEFLFIIPLSGDEYTITERLWDGRPESKGGEVMSTAICTGDQLDSEMLQWLDR